MIILKQCLVQRNKNNNNKRVSVRGLISLVRTVYTYIGLLNVHVHTVYYMCSRCSHSTGATSCNCPPTNTGVIVGVTVVNSIILLATITLLVIIVILITRRKRDTQTVNYGEDSKGTVQIYDEVDDSIGLKRSGTDTKVYQDIDVSKMEDRNQYATMK